MLTAVDIYKDTLCCTTERLVDLFLGSASLFPTYVHTVILKIYIHMGFDFFQ